MPKGEIVSVFLCWHVFLAKHFLIWQVSFWHQKNLVWFISSIKYQDYPFISRFLLYLDEIDEFSIAGKMWFSESPIGKWTWSCSGARVLLHPNYIWQFPDFYWSIILWWFCWLRVPLFRIFPCWLWWRLFSYCVQLMGNILWLIMEGFGYPYSLAHYGRFWSLPWRASSPIWWL